MLNDAPAQKAGTAEDCRCSASHSGSTRLRARLDGPAPPRPHSRRERLYPSSHPIAQIGHTLFLSAVIAAIIGTILFRAVPDDARSAMLHVGASAELRARNYRTCALRRHHNLKSIVVAASFTCRHLPTCTLQALASSTDKQRVLKQLGYLVKLLAGIEQLKQL
jgi:hypothetical protein